MKSNSSLSRIYIGGKISFVPQEAWIMQGTVKENILFG
jgi:ABC-type multidrug transport system fused ATPase/permease subunit